MPQPRSAAVAHQVQSPARDAVAQGIRVLIAVSLGGRDGAAVRHIINHIGTRGATQLCPDADTCRIAVSSQHWDAVVLADDLVGRRLLSDMDPNSGAVAIMLVADDDDPAGAQQQRARFTEQGAFVCLQRDEVNAALVACALDAVRSHQRRIAAQESLPSTASSSVQDSTLRSRRGLDRELLLACVDKRLGQGDDARFSLLVASIRDFAALREGLGPVGSEELIATFRERLRQGLPAGTAMAYLGAGRFGWLVEGEPPGVLLAEIREAMVQPVAIDGEDWSAAIDVGMTQNTRRYVCADDLIRDGIIAARTAGEQQRDQIFETSMRSDPREQLRMEMDLRSAVANHDFSLNYQPIVEIATACPIGFEALLRWQSPTLGRISPARFIPIAEQSGLIIELGRWVIDQASAQLASWDDELELGGRMLISVNVSAKQLCRPQLVDDVKRALDATGLEPSQLKLEFTETAMTEDPEVVAGVLTQCRELGAQIWVDDFGTGYSSLAYLQRFPIDGLKLDKSFVDPLDGTEQSARLARAVLEIARSVGASVVAEGIETEVQAQQLCRMGCRWGQGYLFARPMVLGDAYQYIASHMRCAAG